MIVKGPVQVEHGDFCCFPEGCDCGADQVNELLRESYMNGIHDETMNSQSKSLVVKPAPLPIAVTTTGGSDD